MTVPGRTPNPGNTSNPGIAERKKQSRDEYVGALRSYYNGFRFSTSPVAVYNPFGLLLHFKKGGDFFPFWYESATPTFVIKLVAKNQINIHDLSNMLVDYSEFGKYDIDNLDPEPLLYQTGYLTITEWNDDTNTFTLDFPNTEVRQSFARSLLDHYLRARKTKPNALHVSLVEALEKGQVDQAMEGIRRYLASIPYDIIVDTERYYHTVVHLILTKLGTSCRSEVRTANGRIDSVIEIRNFVYCFEFKLDKSADKAMAQIDRKEYILPWKGSGKTIFKVAVDFDSQQKNIGEYKVEVVGPLPG